MRQRAFVFLVYALFDSHESDPKRKHLCLKKSIYADCTLILPGRPSAQIYAPSLIAASQIHPGPIDTTQGPIAPHVGTLQDPIGHYWTP